MRVPEGWETERVRANGTELQCYQTGTGPPVLLAHGYRGGSARWAPLVHDLAAGYRVAMYDARGHGRSRAPDTGYSLDDRVADLRGVVRELDLADPVLVGHSMGAATVAWVAARHPALPRGVVLEDPTLVHALPDSPSDERAEAMRARIEATANRTVGELVEEEYADVARDRARQLAIAWKACSPHVAEIVREGYPAPIGETFSRITCRTLVLRRDAEVGLRIDDLEAAAALQQGRVIHLPGASHTVFRDRYGAAYTELQTFLRRLPPVGEAGGRRRS